MTELNEEGKEFQITFEDYKSFKIGDTSNFGEYKKGGVVYQIKKPIKKRYLEFIERANRMTIILLIVQIILKVVDANYYIWH